MGSCDYWVKRYTGGRLQIECDDQIIKVFQKADKTPQEELAEDESIKYSNIQDKDVIVIYAKPKQEVIQEISDKFRAKNIILRQIYDSCFHTDNNSYSTINQGIGIHFQINYGQATFKHDLIWKIINHLHAINTEEIIEWQTNVVCYYQWQLLINLKKKHTVPQIVDLLQNHLNYIKGNFQKAKTIDKQQLTFDFNISKEEYALINYKLIPLSVWSYDPVVIDKEIRKIKVNSQALGAYTDQLKQMYDNILRYQRTMESISPAFRPSFIDGMQTHITITDNSNTSLPSNQSNSLHQLFTDDFKMKLNSNLNIIQVFLYLNISSNTYQDKLLIALVNLQNQGVSMQIHVSITSSHKNDFNKIQLIYQCLDVYSNSLTLLQQILADYDSYSKACMEDSRNQENKFENVAQRAINVCSDLNICVFPLMLINEQAIDQPQLFDLINEAKDSKKIESFLKDMILDRSQEALKVLETQLEEGKLASLDFQDFHYISRYQNFTSTFSYQCVNNYQFRKDLPLIKYKDNSKFKESTIVLISVYSTQKNILKEMKEWVSQMNNSDSIEFHEITDISKLLIKGYIPLGKSSYIFINGMYVPMIESQWQLEELIMKELTKLTALTMGINLKQHAFAFLTEINFMNILNDKPDKIDEFDFITKQLQNQTIKLTQGYSNNKNNAPLIIKAKLILLSKVSVTFLSYLNQSQQAFDLNICWFVSSQLKIMQQEFQYHYYRLLWNTDGQSSLLVDDLKFKYPYILIDLDQFKFNFGIDSISHRPSLFDMDNNQSKSDLFRWKGTLVFDTEKLKKLDNTVQISFTLNQVWTLGQVMLTQSDLKLSKSYKESRDTFIIMDIQNVVDQRLPMAEYLYIGVIQPGRYYVLKSGSDQAIKFDFDGSAYQLESSSIYFNLNYVQEEQSYDHFSNSVSHLTPDYEESSIYNSENQTSIQFFFVVAGPLFENLQLNQIYQIVKVYQGKKEINIFILENMLISPEFKKHLETIRKNLPYFNYEFLNFAWPYQLVHQPNIFRNLVLYYKILFTDQIIPLRVHGRVLFKDADQCLTSDQNDISELFNAPLNSKPFGLVVHGNQGLGANMAARQLAILNLASSNDFYCAALILTDLESLRANATNQGLRNYINKLHDEGITIDYLHSFDQGLMNLANRDGNIITALPDGWLWSEDFWNEDSKAHAKNIDLQSTQTRDQKLQFAFKTCPGYKENYDELVTLLKQ